MIVRQQHLKILFITIAVALVGCATVEESPKKNGQLGLITTPPTYYTTQKARYLGEKYKNNLDRLVERIVSNQKTAKLQFANNIASVGGIGFLPILRPTQLTSDSWKSSWGCQRPSTPHWTMTQKFSGSFRCTGRNCYQFLRAIQISTKRSK